jgi:hypothetical protein
MPLIEDIEDLYLKMLESVKSYSLQQIALNVYICKMIKPCLDLI